MKKYLFLLVLFGCLVASCVKDPPSTFEATVKGRVLEVDSEVGIPNMTVKLVEADNAQNRQNGCARQLSVCLHKAENFELRCRRR